MTNDEEPSNDRELRSLLERIAATAGDPPAHGLASVALLRRRRKRHRRGAVAAAVALAVSVAGGGTWLIGPRDNGHDVSVASQMDTEAETTELPDVLHVQCSPAGIEVPVASIQPQSDGLHVEILNRFDDDVELRVTSESTEWDSGSVLAEPGQSELLQPVPPGVLTVGCGADGIDERRRVDLVDESGLYTPPELSCPDETGLARELPEALPIDPPSSSYTEAVRSALEGTLGEDDDVEPLDGYPDETFGHPTTRPMVQVIREGDTIALVTLEPDEDEGRWLSATVIEACGALLPAEEAEPSDEPAEGEGDAAEEAASTRSPTR